MVNFFMYGVLSGYFLLNVVDYDLVLYWVVRFSCINGVLLAVDPFIDYRMNGTYMTYGFNMLMYSFSGLCVGYFYNRDKRYLLPMMLEILLILIYGNKGAGITAGCFLRWNGIHRKTYETSYLRSGNMCGAAILERDCFRTN